MGIPNYDTWKLATPEEARIGKKRPVCECEHCGNDLFAGDEVVEDTLGGIYFCDYECFDEHYHENTHLTYLERRW